MPGKSITQNQVKLYMSNRKNPKQSQVTSAAKAGFSERTARRIEKGEHQVNHLPREYRTRKDPFKGLFEKYLIPLLEENPELQPITLLEVLDEEIKGQFTFTITKFKPDQCIHNVKTINGDIKTAENICRDSILIKFDKLTLILIYIII